MADPVNPVPPAPPPAIPPVLAPPPVVAAVPVPPAPPLTPPPAAPAAPIKASPPPASEDPNATIGSIGGIHGIPAIPAAAPSLEDLAKFPAPPPIVAPPAVATPPAGPVVLGDTSQYAGLKVGHLVPTTAPVMAPAAPALELKTWDDLPVKTQAEIKFSWLRANPGKKAADFDPVKWVDTSDAPAVKPTAVAPSQAAKVMPVVKAADPEPDLDNLSAKTKAEMAMGKKVVAQRQADYEVVKAKVAESNAAAVAANKAPTDDSMSYTAGH